MCLTCVITLSILCCAVYCNDLRGSTSPKTQSDNSALENLSQDQLQKILQQVIDKNENIQPTNNSCSKDFESPEAQIIRTKDSLANGATFVKALYGVDNAEECKEKCCHFEVNNGSSVTCDAAVFQIHKSENKPQCFLFSCFQKPSKQFLCLFSPNLRFSLFKRKPNVIEQELQDVINGSPKSSTKLKMTVTQDSTVSSSVASTTKIQNQVSKHTSTTHIPSCSKECGKFEWKCDDGCCIALPSVCDGEYHCADSSDEIGCPTVSNDLLENSLHNLTGIDDVKPSNDKAKENINQKLISSGVEVIKIDDTGKVISNKTENIHGKNDVKKVIVVVEEVTTANSVDTDAEAILPLTIGLVVTASILLLVVCRLRGMKRKLGRRGKPISMDESDYLINGMYL